MPPVGAAAVIIGNEVLSAKIRDANGALLIERLRACGIPLRAVEMVPDDVDVIVDAVTRARKRATHVFTSGGIGPTHDDVTVRAVALALGRRVVRLPEMEALVRKHYQANPTDEALRLAEAPEGTELWPQEGVWFPVLTCERIYMLPGVPQLFRIQLETVLRRIEHGTVVLRQLYLSAREPEIAKVLDAIALATPEVAIGSYPNFDRSLGYAVKVTVEHAEAGPVEKVMARLVAELPAGSIVRSE